MKRPSSRLLSDEHIGKRTRILLDSDVSDDSSSEVSGGVNINPTDSMQDDLLNINQDFARRFEYNQRRAEIHQCTFSKDSEVAQC